jgi:phage anti-repressor protein
MNTIPAEFAEISTICKATEVVIGGRTVIGIADARNLHAGLKVGRRYTTWIRDRIRKYGFGGGADFEVFNRNGQLIDFVASQNGEADVEHVYRLTLDMAKELAMVENNDQGRMARRYFIWAEDVARRLAMGVAHQLGCQQEFWPSPSRDRNLTSNDIRAQGGMMKGIVRKQLEPLVARDEVRDANFEVLTGHVEYLTKRVSDLTAQIKVMAAPAPARQSLRKYQSMRAILHGIGLRAPGMRCDRAAYRRAFSFGAGDRSSS